ncbi:hypothetical protein [Mangrovibacter plantisponsor]|uniref:hypothetical protein n=1 Tax=Mangrovibacter plantisponsor TaxID=451513 RepID=UPI0014754F77|nr:hypothetical protein [Mangrovibacter plantisponsor]
MTKLIFAQSGRVSPNKNQENQFIDFRLLTKKKGKPRFSLLFHQSESQVTGSLAIKSAVNAAQEMAPSGAIPADYTGAGRADTCTGLI